MITTKTKNAEAIAVAKAIEALSKAHASLDPSRDDTRREIDDALSLLEAAGFDPDPEDAVERIERIDRGATCPCDRPGCQFHGSETVRRYRDAVERKRRPSASVAYAASAIVDGRDVTIGTRFAADLENARRDVESVLEREYPGREWVLVEVYQVDDPRPEEILRDLLAHAEPTFDSDGRVGSYRTDGFGPLLKRAHVATGGRW